MNHKNDSQQCPTPPISSEQSELGTLLARWAIAFHMWVLLGYALLGRGFAYLGFPPVFIGEITLGFMLVAFLWNRDVRQVLTLWPAKALVLLMVWTALGSHPYFSTYGTDTFRDAAMIGYGLFAFFFASIIMKNPHLLRKILLKYRRFGIVFLSLMWIIFLSNQMGWVELYLPGSPAKLGTYKGGDILVHLAGITAFYLAGMGQITWPIVLLAAVTFILAGVASRAGILAFGVALLLTLVLRPPRQRLGPIVYGMCLVAILLGLVNPSISYHKRELTLGQLWTNVTSVINESRQPLESSKQWRLSWWSDIVDYTLRGEYFWQGKGFGINLADDDGYQVTSDSSLRSPHNGHLTILARAGVSGLLLWVFTHGSWFVLMLRGHSTARKRGDDQWRGVFTFLIVYWSAFMANATFDVFIEGPMGGIWLWTVFGIGMAAALVYRNRPEAIGQ